jgi:hypothetical protein
VGDALASTVASIGARERRDEMSDGHPVVVLSTTVEHMEVVVGVFGPYESEDEASEDVGILRDPEMLKRLRDGQRQQISTSQHRLEDPSAFLERVEELLGG